MKLRPEYEDIVAHVADANNWTGGPTYRAVQLCQELADRPPKMLSDEEINSLFSKASSSSWWEYARAIEAAVHAKQKEFVTKRETCRIYKHKNGTLQVWTKSTSDAHSALDCWVGEEFEIEMPV